MFLSVVVGTSLTRMRLIEILGPGGEDDDDGARVLCFTTPVAIVLVLAVEVTQSSQIQRCFSNFFFFF